MYSVPSDAQYLLVNMCGGQGHGYVYSGWSNIFWSWNGVGGLGGYVSALIPVTELVNVNQLYVYVGGYGNDGSTFNGAGWSWHGQIGGGGTDIRTMFGGIDGRANVTSRIVVAGGGGAGDPSWLGGPGGNGGGLVGGTGGTQNGNANCPGGSQEGPGAFDSRCNGAGLWQGGSCEKGGGGGYYGGGGCPGTGGGGSSYINRNYTTMANVQGDPRCSSSGVVQIVAVQSHENSGICAPCPKGWTTASTNATKCGNLLHFPIYLSICLS